MRRFWRIYVEGGLRHRTVFVSPGAVTVSVWIPPGERELSPEQESAMERLAIEVLDPEQASALFALWERFDQNHPHDEPHAYLSLLARRPDSAGHGLGQAHLGADLARWDSLGVPTYLESSNPANNHRYERQGYAKLSEFRTILDDAVVTTMWRPAR